MDRSARCALIAVALALALALATHTANAGSDDSRAAYNQWVTKYAAKSLDGNILEITLIEEIPQDAHHDAEIDSYNFMVKPNGQAGSESSSAMGGRGGDANAVPPQSLKRLEELASQLPADTGSLPPSERRILIQTPNATRVYDRAELPDPVIEFLRLSGCGISSWVLTFESQRQIDARAPGFLALCPDGKRLLCGSQLLALPTYETLGDLQAEPRYDQLVFSPDGTTAALGIFDCEILDVSTGKMIRKLSEPRQNGNEPALYDPHFTPDGRYLLLRISDNGIAFFDTKTWQRVSPTLDIPTDVNQWKPSKSWQHAVMHTNAGVVSVWDVKTKSAMELDPAARLLDAAFSPDESQLALITADKDGYSNQRLRIFQTDTAKLVRELRTGEMGGDRMRLPTWTPDGRYILAATSSFGCGCNTVSLWSLKTGRHRADFVCQSLSGFLFLPGGNQLIVNSDDGTIRIWDFKAATREISALEDALAPSPAH